MKLKLSQSWHHVAQIEISDPQTYEPDPTWCCRWVAFTFSDGTRFEFTVHSDTLRLPLLHYNPSEPPAQEELP